MSRTNCDRCGREISGFVWSGPYDPAGSEEIVVSHVCDSCFRAAMWPHPLRLGDPAPAVVEPAPPATSDGPAGKEKPA